jgi:hypothetical protein
LCVRYPCTQTPPRWGCIQGYLAHKKTLPPRPKTTIGPLASACCKVLGKAFSYERGIHANGVCRSVLVQGTWLMRKHLPVGNLPRPNGQKFVWFSLVALS